MVSDDPDKQSAWASQLAASAVKRLRAEHFVAFTVPVTCHVEFPEMCGFHALVMGTAGVDLEMVCVLQLLQDPVSNADSSLFGFAIALHLENKPKVRLVLTYTCKPEDLLVPTTRWVLRSPTASVVVLAPPRAEPDHRPMEMLIYAGDLDELMSAGEIKREDSDSVEIVDKSVARRLQMVLERLWYWELRLRQMEPERQHQGPGTLARSIRFAHCITASHRVVCMGGVVGKSVLESPGKSLKDQVDHLTPTATSWEQFEAQVALVSNSFACVEFQDSSETTFNDKSAKRRNPVKAKQKKKKSLSEVDRERSSEADCKADTNRDSIGNATSNDNANDMASNNSQAPDSSPPSISLEDEEEEHRHQSTDEEESGVKSPREELARAQSFIELRSLESEPSFGWQISSKKRDKRGKKGLVASLLGSARPNDSDGADSLHARVDSESSWEDLSTSNEGHEEVQNGKSPAASSLIVDDAEEKACSSANPPGSPKSISSASSFSIQEASRSESQRCSNHFSVSSPDEFDVTLQSETGRSSLTSDATESIRKIASDGSVKIIKFTRSWADMSENMEDEEEDINPGAESRSGCAFEAAYLREQVTKQLHQKEIERETSWTEVHAVLEELPQKVADALTGAVKEATGDLHITERRLDVPADQRCWSTGPDASSEVVASYGLLSEAEPWVSPISELGQWYELRRPEPGLICGVVMTGDKLKNWVEIVKLKVLTPAEDWMDVDGGALFQACRNAEDPVEVDFEPVTALGVRIYPVVWHGGIVLRAALLEPKHDAISLGDEASEVFREDARLALQGMMSEELSMLKQLVTIPKQNTGGIADLVSTLYSIPTKVADAATRFESSILKAWREKTRADDALHQARQWVEAIPEDQPLAMAARAQAAAMDQVSEALMVLEELHSITASSVADTMLRAKIVNAMTASESGRVQQNLNKKLRTQKRPIARNRSGPSSCTLGTVAEHEAFLSGEPDTEPTNKKLEFWLDLFLNAHAFRVGGPADSLIWDPEEVWISTEGGEKKKRHYRNFSYRIDDKVSSSECDSTSAWQTGEAGIGEIIEVKGVDAWRTAFISGFMGGMRTSGSLAPLRLSTRDNMFRPIHAECHQVVIQRVGSTSDEALSVIDGRIQLLPGRQGWEHEQMYRQWSVTKNELGYRFRFGDSGELAAEGTSLVLKEVGIDWKLNPVTGADGLAVHLMSGKSSIVPLPGGHVEFSSSGSRNHSWHIYQQSHGSQKPALSVFRSYQLEPGKGVFHAAKVWKKTRNPATAGDSNSHENGKQNAAHVIRTNGS